MNLKRQHSYETSSLYVVILLFGILTIIAQVVYVREFMVIGYGNELYLGLIFACWFAGIACGAFVASLFTDRLTRPFGVFLALFLLQGILAVFDVYVIRHLRLLFGVPVGEIFPFGSFLAASALTIIPFTFLTGVNFPLLCGHMKCQSVGESGAPIGFVYWLDSLGSIIGSLGFTYALVFIFPGLQLMSTLAVVISGVIFIVLVLKRKSEQKKSVLCKLIGMCFIVLLGLHLSPLLQNFETGSIQRRWESLAPGIPLVKTKNSKFQNITLSRQAGQYNVATDGKFIASFPDDYGTPPLVHLIFLQPQEPPERGLIIGGGNPEILYTALKYKLKRIDYVEHDAALLEFLMPYLREEVRHAYKDPRVHVYATDGRRFVKYEAPRQDLKYDIIWISVPDPSTVALNRYYTLEFYEEVKKILAPRGVVVAQSTSAVNYLGEQVLSYLGSIAKTMMKVFPELIITPGERAFLFAAMHKDIITVSPEALIKRYETYRPEPSEFTPYVFHTMLEDSQVKMINQTVLSSIKRIQINTDLNPLTYFYNLALWSYFTGFHAIEFFEWIKDINLLLLCLFLAILLLTRYLYLALIKPPKSRITRFNGLVLLTATGFNAMAGELIIIVMFQSAFGYIYYKIGLIIAAFMGGLVIGGKMITEHLPDSSARSVKVLATVEALFIVLLTACFLGAPVLMRITIPGQAVQELLFYLATMLLGILGGIEFPLVGHILVQNKYKTGYSAAIVDSLDHVGAALGSFATGIILIPALGIRQSFLALAIVKVTTLILLKLRGR